MSIDYRLAKAILQEHAYRPITGTILLVGRQTITLTHAQAVELIKSENIRIRPEAVIEIDANTYGSQGRSLITDRTFFSLFSTADVIAMDVSDYEGAEIIADLNQPIPEKFHNIADFMFNGSCMDNLFDPASALKNMSRLLKPGGRIVHIEHGSPVQGSYLMYSPAMFFDYYAINHFNDCKNYVLFFQDVLDPWNVFLWEAYDKKDDSWIMTPYMHNGWNNILNLIIAEKGENSTCDATPIQGFYRQAHISDKDEYLEAFKRFRSTKRPLISLDKPKDGIPGGEPPAGFTYLGVLKDPELERKSLSLQEIEKARCYCNEKQTEKAIESFTRAIEFSENVGHPGLVFVERGDIYAQQGQQEQALADYNRAISIHPDPNYLSRKETLEASMGKDLLKEEAIPDKILSYVKKPLP